MVRCCVGFAHCPPNRLEEAYNYVNKNFNFEKQDDKKFKIQNMSLNIGYNLAVIIIATGLAAFIIANKVTNRVRFYNEYSKGSDSDHRRKIDQSIKS